MFLESLLLTFAVFVAFLSAALFDYVTKFFSYWYIRYVPYKIPVPFFGSDYHRVLNLRSTSEEVKKLYNKYPKENFVGAIKNRIPELIVKDPDVIKKMLATDFANFHCRGIGLDKSQDVCLRNNLFYAEGEKWTLLREGLDSILSNVDGELEVCLHVRLSGSNEVVNVQDLLSEVLDAVFKDCLFEGTDGRFLITQLRQSVQRRNIVEKLKSYLKEVFPSLFVFLRLTTTPFSQTVQTNDIIEQSSLLTSIRKCGLAEQLNGTIKKGDATRTVSEMELAHSMVSLFVTEGYIPCLNVITSLLFELAKNPRIQGALRDCNSINCNYLDMCIKEALRLYCPYPVITRKCVIAYQVPESKMTLDKNITITVPVEAMHHDSKYYKNPLEFNPDRFSESEYNMKHKLTYFPFGAGARKCIGEQFALKIIRNVTVAVLRKYKIEATKTTPQQLCFIDHNFMKIIKDDVWLKLTPLNCE